jgi:DDE superfamily endonuclease
MADRFKQRYGIRELTIQEERLSGCVVAADKFCIEFQEHCQLEDLQSDQIYNADETGLYWKCLPTKTLASSKEKSTPGHKSSKERITVMCCGNASGNHKMKLLVIGKAKKPRSFKGTEMKNLPVDYYSQKGAWMNREIFEDWFKTKWVPEVTDFLKSKGLPQKAVLLIDNAPSHPNETILKTNDGFMIAKFLPPNVTSLIQPMDQGVISSMKRLYRADLLKILAEEDDDLINFWKKLSVLDAIHGIAKSWSKVKPITLVRSWRKILPNVEIDLSDSEEIETGDTSEIYRIMENLKCFKSVDRENIEEWFDRDSNDPGFQCMSDADIVSHVTQTEEGESGDSENTSEDDTDNYISFQTALTSVEILLDFVDQKGFEYNYKISLRKIRNEIRKLLKDSQKQTRITDFFNK